MGARAYRVVGFTTADNTFFGIAGIQFRATVGGAPQTGGTAIASSFYTPSTPDLFPSNAFDGNIATAWANENGTFLPAWIGMDYGVGANIECEELGIESYSAPQQAPTSFILQRTNDNPLSVGARWYDHSLRLTSTGWTANTLRLFGPFSPTNALTAYKVAGNALTGGETALVVAGLRGNALTGDETGLVAAGLRANVLSGAQPNRLDVSGLRANVLSGAQPLRLDVSGLRANVLVFIPDRAVNGPVQII
jgi:hypothetical protein